MPLYEYRCSKCGKKFELIRKFSDPPVTIHEECGGQVERLISSPAFHLKGHGWYATDYAKKSSAGTDGGKSEEAKAGSDNDSKSEGKPDAKSEGKSEEKSGAKTDASSPSKGGSKADPKSDAKPAVPAAKPDSQPPTPAKAD